MSDTTRPELLRSIKASLSKEVKRLDANLHDSWEEFFGIYNTLLYKFAAKLQCPHELADDVVSAVWMDVLKYLPTLEYDTARAGFRRWLYRIVRSKTIDELRRRQPRSNLIRISLDTDFWRNHIDDKGPVPSDRIEQVFEEEVVQATLERYFAEASESEAAIVQRCLMESMTPSAAARELNVTPEAARKALQRGRFRLRVIAAELFGLEAIS